MQISLITAAVHAVGIDPTAALVSSARNLNADERYILSQLSAGISRDLSGATAYPGVNVLLPVTDFAEHVGVKGKAAYRRLGAAAETIFGRTVKIEDGNGIESHFRWVTSMSTYDDGFELLFTSFFVQHLLLAVARSGSDVNPVPAAISLDAGPRSVPTFGAVLVVDPGWRKRKRRTRRPRKTMTWIQLLHRVKKRLKKTMLGERAEMLIEMTRLYEPWCGKSRLQFYGFTARDQAALFNWLMERKDDPDFIEG